MKEEKTYEAAMVIKPFKEQGTSRCQQSSASATWCQRWMADPKWGDVAWSSSAPFHFSSLTFQVPALVLAFRGSAANNFTSNNTV